MLSSISTLTLLLNGITLALSLSFLIIILWHDSRKEQNQFFAIFLLMVMVWNAGYMLAQSLLIVDDQSPLLPLLVGIMELGFTGSSAAIYAFTAVLVKLHSRRFRRMALAALFMMLVYRLLLIVASAPAAMIPVEPGQFTFRGQPLTIAFYLLFDGAALFLVWRYRHKLRARALRLGIVGFIVGQSLGLLNPELQAYILSVSVSTFSALIIGFAIVYQEIIRPLRERNSQVDAIGKVSASIVSQNAVEEVLHEVTKNIAHLLKADAVAIFLLSGEMLRLETAYQLPRTFLGTHVRVGQGVTGTAVAKMELLQIDDYRRDWRGEADLPLARETFGSVLAAPLIYGHAPIGAVLVIAGRHNRLFEKEDAYLLGLLGAQASVAIAHSRLFSEQKMLTREVETARAQLETVLSSTESPVIAVNRELRLIFANPAAKALFSTHDVNDSVSISALFPENVFPKPVRSVLRTIRRDRVFNYEIALKQRVYSCHLAALGNLRRIEGWVAVLNDITQLKELDRMKSEMVRMTSHDLKNPLQAAMANLELLRDDVAASASEEVQQSLENIDVQLQRMYRIIRGILDMERIRSGSLALEPCSPARIVDDVVYELRLLADTLGVRLETNVPADLPSFNCDVEQFERAIINLVENALKFTPSGGCVRLAVHQSAHGLVFEIQDTGVGIAPELQERIFERFFRAKQRGVEHVTGSGLGLSLVKTVVENHRGRIWLNSHEGQGTQFFVELPVE